MSVSETRQIRLASEKSREEKERILRKTKRQITLQSVLCGHKKQSHSLMKVSIELERPAEIVINSRASEHIVFDSSFLIYVPQVPFFSVETANGTRASSMLCGQKGIETKPARVLVRAVRSVPDTSTNILFSSRLKEKRVTTTVAKER